MSIKINNDNYDTYKKVFEIIYGQIWKHFKGKIPAESNPIAVLNSLELKSKSLAKRGLQASLNDSLSSLKEYSKPDLSKIDSDLKNAGLPDLSILLGAIKKTIDNVLLKKKIKNLDQYYIIKEVLDDTTSDISAEERSSLSASLMKFELNTSN